MPMSSFRLRTRAEHRALRRRAARLERTATAVAEGVLPRDLLDADLRALQDAMSRHLAWEERLLIADRLAATDAPEEAILRIHAAHRELEDVLALCSGSPGCQRVPTPVATGRALALASLVREELRAEDDRLRGDEGAATRVA